MGDSGPVGRYADGMETSSIEVVVNRVDCVMGVGCGYSMFPDVDGEVGVLMSKKGTEFGVGNK